MFKGRSGAAKASGLNVLDVLEYNYIREQQMLAQKVMEQQKITEETDEGEKKQ